MNLSMSEQDRLSGMETTETKSRIGKVVPLILLVVGLLELWIAHCGFRTSRKMLVPVGSAHHPTIRRRSLLRRQRRELLAVTVKQEPF